MTRRYEIVYIFDSANEEPQIEKHLDRFHAVLKSKENPDPIRNANHWGKRSLAYPIAGNEIGYYVVVQFSTDPTLLPEFERLLKLEEAVIRHQIVLNEGEVPVPAPVPDASDDRKGSDKEKGSAEDKGSDKEKDSDKEKGSEEDKGSDKEKGSEENKGSDKEKEA